MIVYCPGCGSSIDVPDTAAGKIIRCGGCKSEFPLAGVKKTSGVDRPRGFKKKKSRGYLPIVLTLALLAVLLAVPAGLYFAGIWPFAAPKTVVTKVTPIPKTGGTDKVTAGAGWKPFESSEGKFKTLFPGEPKRNPRQHNQRNLRYRDVAYELEREGVRYSIVFADLDQAGLKGVTPEQYIAGRREELVQGKAVKLLEEKDLVHGNSKGKEFVVEVPGSQPIHLRLFAAGRRLYSVMVHGLTRKPDQAEIDKFFDAFELVD